MKAQLLNEATVKYEYLSTIHILRKEKKALAVENCQKLRDREALKDEEVSQIGEQVRCCNNNLFKNWIHHGWK